VGRSKQLSKKDVKTFVDQLHAECAGISEGPEASPSLLKKRFHESLVVSDHAQRLWTCTEQVLRQPIFEAVVGKSDMSLLLIWVMLSLSCVVVDARQGVLLLHQ